LTNLALLFFYVNIKTNNRTLTEEKMDLEKHENSVLVLGGILVLATIISFFFSKAPGPDKGAEACAIDQNTLGYEIQMDIPSPLAIRVGQQGNLFEALVSLTPLDDGTWQAVFRNIVSGRTATYTLRQCSNK
jgi:hypothetical protein